MGRQQLKDGAACTCRFGGCSACTCALNVVAHTGCSHTGAQLLHHLVLPLCALRFQRQLRVAQAVL